MKSKTLFMAGIALVLALCLNNSQAQTTNAPAPGPAGLAPAPPPGQRPPPRARQPRIFITRALNDLRMVKADLERSQDDFGGHKDSAIEACQKAMDELQAVMKASPPQPAPQPNAQPPGAGAPPPPSLRMTPPAGTPPAGAPPAQPPQ
jgi:hypothetical protein